MNEAVCLSAPVSDTNWFDDDGLFKCARGTSLVFVVSSSADLVSYLL